MNNTQEAKKLTPLQRDELATKIGADTIGWSAKQQCYIAKRHYFYTHGMTAEKLVAAIKLALPGATVTVIEAADKWHAWPRDSWFEVRFQFTMPVQVPVTCDQCALAGINGVACHETGCPNSGKTWNGEQWIKVLKCRECGSEVEAGEVCCQEN